ncbi:kinase-like protein, partial [Schizopora paradoxa]
IHKNLCKEVLLWRQLHHPNILEFLGIWKDSSTLPAIVSAWMENGNVTQFCQTLRRPIPFQDCKQLKYRLLGQVARALDYLHTHTPVIVHQDVRCANILVNDACEAVLSDFGLSRLDSSFFNTFTSSLEHGCLRWQAPELLFPDNAPAFIPNPTPASDIYALGMTALELLTGQKPYSRMTIDAAVIMEVYHNRRPAYHQQVDKQAWRFFLTCWSRNPLDRP